MIHEIEFRAMGCQVNVQLDAGTHGADILRAVPEQVAQIEGQLTRFRSDSDLMRLNDRAGEWVAVSDILLANIRAAKQAAFLTDGLYNPLILPALIANGYDRTFEQIDKSSVKPPLPAADWREIRFKRDSHEVFIPRGGALDLGGIAKGWTAGHLADTLAEYGACLVNIGGDIVGRGAPQAYDGWPVQIEDPLTSDTFVAFSLRDQSMMTSGIDYRRWQDTDGGDHHHILDPRTGRSAQTDVVAVSVLHSHAPTAEAFAKAVLLKGTEAGLNWLNQQWHSAGVVFKVDGAVMATSNFNNYLQKRNTSL